jgi:hypothetical protein
MVGRKDGGYLLIFEGNPLQGGKLISRMKKEGSVAELEFLLQSSDTASILSSSSTLTPEDSRNASMIISVSAALCWFYLAYTDDSRRDNSNQANDATR